MNADTCAKLILSCVEWLWTDIEVSCACLRQRKHCDSQQVLCKQTIWPRPKCSDYLCQQAVDLRQERDQVRDLLTVLHPSRLVSCPPLLEKGASFSHGMCFCTSPLLTSLRLTNQKHKQRIRSAICGTVHGQRGRRTFCCPIASLNWCFKSIASCYKVWVSDGNVQVTNKHLLARCRCFCGSCIALLFGEWPSAHASC